jgi:SAM-dependent methyltransferase
LRVKTSPANNRTRLDKPGHVGYRKESMDMSRKALAASRRTIMSYEQFAPEYDKLIDEIPPTDVQGALRRMVALIPPSGVVLEVGSGPGRDADFVEMLGAIVRRTDATQTFLDIQAARGKRGELLNLLTDDLGGPYDAVLALCTLIHIDRGHTSFVLRKIADALRPGGAFLVSVREGKGETTGNYQMTYWSHAAFATRLETVGLRIECSDRRIDVDNDVWITFLCRRPA